MKSISVLLAAYQGAKYLPEQLRSLAAQDDCAFRVLMQDDGSQDGTAALLEKQAEQDPRFQLAAEQGRHFGAKGNFWSLLRQDDAPYTALCDQDDAWTADRLSRCRKAIEAAEAQWGEDTPILVHSDCCVTDETGNTLHESFFAHQGWDPQAVTLSRLIVQNNVTGCTVLMNAALRKLAVRFGDPETMFMHDWFLALTAAAFGHVVFVREPLVRYRQHGKNVLGASRRGLIARGIAALGALKRGRERILLTYRHAQAFRDAFGTALPEEAARTVDAYLATQKRWKPVRVWVVQRGGYCMQSTVTRAGQVFFG